MWFIKNLLTWYVIELIQKMHRDMDVTCSERVLFAEVRDHSREEVRLLKLRIWNIRATLSKKK